MTVGARIQKRRDTAANWTSANPVLADGEEGYEKNTGRSKVGNGSTAWSSLPYNLQWAPPPSGGDDSSVLQALINEMTFGGVLLLRAGTYLANLQVGSRVTIRGAGTQVTTLKAPNGSNADVIKGKSYATLTGTSPTTPEAVGDNYLELHNLTIDGNKANNSAGYGIRIWGRSHRWSNVIVRNCKQDGIRTEFSYEVTSFSGDDAILESNWEGIHTVHNDGNGWTHKGPHDAWLNNYVTLGNGGWGFESTTGATHDGGVHGDHWNSYLNATGSYKFGATFNLGFVIASGVGGTGVEITGVGTSYCHIASLHGGGHATGIILRGTGHIINAILLNCTSEAVLVDGANSHVIDLVTAGCANGVTIGAGGETGAGVWRGVVALTGGQTLKTGNFSSVSSIAFEVPGGTGLRQWGSRTIKAGGYTPSLPADDNTIITDLGATTVHYKSMGATNTYRGLTIEGDVKPAVTGSRGGNAALTSLLSALATLGVITNSSST